MINLFFAGLKGAQLIFIAVIVLLLFGTSRIPSIMRNLGKGVHSFRQGIEDAKEEINREVRKAGQPDKSTDADTESGKIQDKEKEQ